MGDPARYDGTLQEPPYRTDLEERIDELEYENAALRAQIEAQQRGGAVVVPELSDSWCNEKWREYWRKNPDYGNICGAVRFALEEYLRIHPIPADRVLEYGMVGVDRFGTGFVEACGILAAKPFDRPTTAACLIREGGMVSSLLATTSDGPGISILREEMRSELDALRGAKGEVGGAKM